MAIKIIKDLVDVYEFFEGSILRTDDETKALADAVLLVSNGADGNNEVQAYFQSTVRPGETHAFVQLAETPIMEAGKQVEMIQVKGSIIFAKKLEETKVTNQVRITHSNAVWKSALKLMGSLKLASDYYEQRTDEQADAYDCKIKTDGMISPVHRMANANVVGWYFEFEVEFAVNDLMYG
jgi:hypothetical protein